MSFIAMSTIDINAAPEKVWSALTDPELVKQYMFGAEVVSDWQKGGSLKYKGVWEGKPFEDEGTILEIEPNKLLKSTYYSALSGLENVPENYSVVTYRIESDGAQSKLTVTQENNPTQEAADRMSENWIMTLINIKKLLEQ